MSEEKYEAERMDGGGIVEGDLFHDIIYNRLKIRYHVRRDYYEYEIKPETLKQTGGELFDRVRLCENLLVQMDEYLGEGGINAISSTSIYHNSIKSMIQKLKGE